MKKLKLGNLEVVLPEPYRQGHVCSAKEASLLNSLHMKRLKENITQIANSKGMAYGPAELLPELNKYVRDYSLNGRDPVETEAQALALQIVKQKLKAEGGRLKAVRLSVLKRDAERVLASPLGSTIRRMAITRAEDLAEAVKARLDEER